MSKGRLIALVLVLGVVIALMGSSRLRSSDEPSTPGAAWPLVANVGGAPGSGMLTTDELVDFWRERVERNPSDYISYAELGATFIRSARETGDVDSYSRAEAALEMALEINPNYSSAISYLATVLYAKHDFMGALERAERIYSFDPGAAQALAVVGDSHLELGDYDEAQSAYDKLLDPSQTAPVYSRLARLAELKGHPQESIELLRRAAAEAVDGVTSQESMAWYRLQLGNLYFNTGNLDSAEAEYERSLQAFPAYVHALAGLAKVQAAHGEYDEAASLYGQVVDRYPIPEYVAASATSIAPPGGRTKPPSNTAWWRQSTGSTRRTASTPISRWPYSSPTTTCAWAKRCAKPAPNTSGGAAFRQQTSWLGRSTSRASSRKRGNTHRRRSGLALRMR